MGWRRHFQIAKYTKNTVVVNEKKILTWRLWKQILPCTQCVFGCFERDKWLSKLRKKSGPTPHKEKQNHTRFFIQLDRVQKYLSFFPICCNTHSNGLGNPTHIHTHETGRGWEQSLRSIGTLHYCNNHNCSTTFLSKDRTHWNSASNSS